MITASEVQNILLKDVKSNNVFNRIADIVKDKFRPVIENNVTERIVIVIPGGVDNGQLSRSYPRICIYVPYVKFTESTTYYRPNSARITELEKECVKAFRSGIYGETDSDRYIYKMEDIVIEDDPETFSNFLNVRLKFESVNTKL